MKIMCKDKNIEREYFNNWDSYKEAMLVPELIISDSERESSKKLMRSIFEIQSESYENDMMQQYLYEFLEDLIEKDEINIEYYYDEIGNIYVTKGNAETYPCLVSHIDTVHMIIDDKDYMVIDNDIHFFAINKSSRMPTGIGGDDKCGIYTCLDALIREDVIKIAFFVDEEVGCNGSRDADMEFFKDVSFVFQADRKGYVDVASNIFGIVMLSDDFGEKMKGVMNDYGRSFCEGGMTDVMQLAENELGVCMANFSCGYYEPHSKYEYVIIDELILTSLMFRDLIRELYVDGQKHEIVRTDREFIGGYHSFSGSPLPSESGKYHGNHSTCTSCRAETMYDIDAKMYFCNNCMDYDYGAGSDIEATTVIQPHLIDDSYYGNDAEYYGADETLRRAFGDSETEDKPPF